LEGPAPLGWALERSSVTKLTLRQLLNNTALSTAAKFRQFCYREVFYVRLNCNCNCNCNLSRGRSKMVALQHSTHTAVAQLITWLSELVTLRSCDASAAQL
jgi:hypothetical protein